jgi:hypothetical protein
MKNQIVTTFAQQGDVTLRKLDAIPEGKSKVVSRKRCVLAEGEVTGHCHAVEQSDAELIQIGERMLLKLEREATVTHQEHNPITLSPGIWEIGRVQEYDYFSKMARPVQD